MGAPTFADKIFAVFETSPNVEISLGQIRKNVDGEYTDQQIQTAISNLRNRGKIPIEVVVAGRVYRYTPGMKLERGPEQKQLFESVAKLKNGDLLLQDENGVIFRAVELS